MLSAQLRITPMHTTSAQSRAPSKRMRSQPVQAISPRGCTADTDRAADGAHATRSTSHCEPDALQARSRDAAHWVTTQSSRKAAALQDACSGTEGAIASKARN